ncbi:MAG: tetratricopeptide repeat protein [Bdellovibrionales bacterium]|nr:tetratricopeptide repeat protein [Bdellovibrionales bacterium]
MHLVSDQTAIEEDWRAFPDRDEPAFLPDGWDAIRSSSLTPSPRIEESVATAGTSRRGWLLAVDRRTFFLRAEVTPQIGIWCRISPSSAQQFILAWREGRGCDCAGSCATLLADGAHRFALHSLVQLRYDPEHQHVVAIEAYDELTPFPGLASLLATGSDSPVLLPGSVLRSEDKQRLVDLEGAVQENDVDRLASLVATIPADWRYRARAQFALGHAYTRLQRHSEAFHCFHQAQLLDHPFALEEEWRAHSRLTKPFREAHPELFEHIQRGDRLRTLTQLRTLAPQHPVAGNAVLAYCLRGAGVPEEGLAACDASLKHRPDQSDVLGHRWTYLTELGRDEEALRCARDHIRRYPRDLAAIVNLIDSALLTGRVPEAKALAEIFAIQCDDLDRQCQTFFKVYEQAGDWPTLLAKMSPLVRSLHAPTIKTLVCWGETLIESSHFDDAFAVFETALRADPADGQVLLNYARGLARADREEEAEQLLRTATRDASRVRSANDYVFLVTLLAEICRRTGRPEESLSLFDGLNEDMVGLSNRVGPLPALEYAEALMSTGDFASAEDVVARLTSLWPTDIFVREVAEILAGER